MDLMKIGLYGLAGFGAYSLYERLTAKKEASTTTTTTATVPFTGTQWQRQGYGGTRWQDAPYSNITGTRWQQDTPVGTRWQDKGVFNNASGSYAGRNWLAGTNWQKANMSNACGACAA